MSNKIKKCYLKNVGVGQNQEMYYKNVEQNQEVHVEQIQVDMSNKMMCAINRLLGIVCQSLRYCNARPTRDETGASP